jgi:hypothetical protein
MASDESDQGSSADSPAEAASSARWKALGDYYLARIEASAAASSARYEAMAKSFGASGEGPSSENPELSFARRSYNAAGFLAENPEVISARSFSPATISGDMGAGFLAENPELNSARGSYDQGYVACTLNGDELAMNPELAFAQQARGC